MAYSTDRVPPYPPQPIGGHPLGSSSTVAPTGGDTARHRGGRQSAVPEGFPFHACAACDAMSLPSDLDEALSGDSTAIREGRRNWRPKKMSWLPKRNPNCHCTLRNWCCVHVARIIQRGCAPETNRLEELGTVLIRTAPGTARYSSDDSRLGRRRANHQSLKDDPMKTEGTSSAPSRQRVLKNRISAARSTSERLSPNG